MNLTSNTLLEKYLDTNCEAYRQYVQLINENKDATLKPTKERQVHHIIPRSFFKRDKLEVDNSKENKVSLRIKDHYIAHFLLWRCVKKRYLVQASWAYLMMNSMVKLNNEADPYYNSELYEQAMLNTPKNFTTDISVYNKRMKAQGCRLTLLERSPQEMKWRCDVCGMEWATCSCNHYLTTKKPLCPKCKVQYGKESVWVAVFFILNNRAYWSIYHLSPPSIGNLTKNYVKIQLDRGKRHNKLSIIEIIPDIKGSYEQLYNKYKQKFGEDRCGHSLWKKEYKYSKPFCEALNYLIKVGFLSKTFINELFGKNTIDNLYKCNDYYNIKKPIPDYQPNAVMVISDTLGWHHYLSELAEIYDCTAANIRHKIAKYKKQGIDDIDCFYPSESMYNFIKDIYSSGNWQEVLARLAIVFRKMDELNPPPSDPQQKLFN